jgi:dTMP kinase
MASSCNPRGAFIVFEGVDRCGKTTQSKLLADYCQSKTGKAKWIRFPRYARCAGQSRLFE